jgi:hypothetical protein
MPAMTQIPEHFKTEFATNWDYLVQQRMSKLKDRVTIEKVNGKEKSFNQLSPTSMSRITSRASETVITDTETSKRWLRPYPYEKADLLDQWDAEYLGDIILPTSELMQNHAMAYGRTCDEIIIDAALGTAFTGESGTTETAFDSNMSIAVNYVKSGGAANSGLTVEKLIQAKYLFDVNNVPEEDPKFVAVSAKQLQDLLNQDKVSSADYNTVRALVAGEINTFLGFTFIRVDRSFFEYVVGTDVRTICAWAKSGIKLSDSGKQSFMDVLPTRSHSIQIRTVASIGATRTEEPKVVRIYCDESPA